MKVKIRIQNMIFYYYFGVWTTTTCLVLGNIQIMYFKAKQ